MVEERDPNDHCGTGDAPDPQNPDDGSLGTRIHAQIPNQGHREKANCQVRDCGAHAVQICDPKKNVPIDTRALSRELVPEIVDRLTHEDGEKQENQANDGGDRSGSIEDPGVDAVDRDAQQGDDDGYLSDDACEDVENLAQPPALSR